ncbi:hypothetical protein GQ457_02G032610 [Hibiscus cannabinus]
MGGDPMVEEATASLGKVTAASHNDGVLKPMRQASKVQKVASYVKLDREVIIDGENPSKMYLYHHDPEADTGKRPNENFMGTQSVPEAIMGDEVFNDSKKDWANSLDKFFNSGKDLDLFAQREVISEGENERDFLVELEERKGKRRKEKTKKFGSLLEIQNKSITVSERRKRDKALKRKKWSKHCMEESELSGKSLSNSDINSRVSILVKEAKQVLKLGKKIGVNFAGDENEVVKDLVELEMNERL